MRKHVTGASLVGATPACDWLDVVSVAVVEVTSEDAAHPVESALLEGEKVAGVLLGRDLRPFDCCSTNRKSCDGSG
jgi:hypothetical protein